MTQHAKNNTQNISGKKGDKVGTSINMDDAPLFAGLDDFAMFQTGRKKKDPPTVEEKATPHQAPQAPPKESMPQQKRPRSQKAQSAAPNSLLLSVAEMCTLLNISRATLVRMDKSGKLPGRIKLGGSVRFHRETVETWLKNLINPPT